MPSEMLAFSNVFSDDGQNLVPVMHSWGGYFGPVPYIFFSMTPSS